MTRTDSALRFVLMTILLTGIGGCRSPQLASGPGLSLSSAGSRVCQSTGVPSSEPESLGAESPAAGKTDALLPAVAVSDDSAQSSGDVLSAAVSETSAADSAVTTDRPSMPRVARPYAPEAFATAAPDRSHAKPSVTHQTTEADDPESDADAEMAVSPVQLVSNTDDAPEPEAAGLTLAELEQLAFEHNPTIRVLSAAAAKAEGIRVQSGAHPNPTMGYSGAQLADRDTDQQGVLLEQDFVLGNKLELNQQVHRQDVQVQLWNLEAQRQRVLTDVRRLFFRTLAAQRRRELTSDFRDVTARGAELARQRLDALQASKPELLQAEIQLSELSLAVRQVEIELEGNRRRLASGVGVSRLPDAELDGSLKPRTLSWDWDVVLSDLLGRSPELQAARASVQRARLHLCRQQAQPIPNLTLQLTGGHDNGTDNGFLNVQATAPIPVFNRNEGNIRAAYADYCRATHEVRRVELALQDRLAAASQSFDDAAAAVQMYQDEIVPRAEETHRLSEVAYEAGEFDFLQILIVRRTWFEANLRYVDALRRLAEEQAQLDGLLLTGGLDPVNGFDGDDSLRGQALDGI